jgi:glucose-1-phosphate thymidylyltransferase
VAGHVDAASTLEGPADIAPGARVVGSRIRGPVVIGPGTLIAGSDVGPDVSVGTGCRLHAAQLTDSIVLDGARLSGVSGLHGSVIGRFATVASLGAGGGRQRLIVGDYSRVETAA